MADDAPLPRDQHLQQARESAFAAIETGRALAHVVCEFIGDLLKHPESQIPTGHGMAGLRAAQTHDANAVRRWIESFE